MALPDSLDVEQDFGAPKAAYGPAADPTKEISAEEYNRIAIGVSMLSISAPRAWVVVSAGASAGSLVRYHGAMWGDTNAVKPTVTATTTGVYAVTWPTSVTDLHPTASAVTTSAVNLRHSVPTLREAGFIWSTVAANVATVHTFSTAWAVAAKDFDLTVY